MDLVAVAAAMAADGLLAGFEPATEDLPAERIEVHFPVDGLDEPVLIQVTAIEHDRDSMEGVEAYQVYAPIPAILGDDGLADAIFGKRTEVRDSHDRYANIEVSYLLQKMEEYDGIVVLASNLRANLDDAFLRRLKAIIEFPFPEEEDRLAIYRRMLAGTSAPLAEDVDLPFMARQFRLAGGSIKNIIIFAAFLAAKSGSPIAMRHLIHATRREYQKLGRLLTESDFAGWYDEVRP